ncbi:MAG: hypothetical protein IT337_11905 [Thermomicrobiales bacterium]|nr:hypothetical protein [Thermomicrobiales bacterium]
MNDADEPQPDAPNSPRASEPTIGIGSVLGIGCLLLVVLAVLVLAAVNFLPHVR